MGRFKGSGIEWVGDIPSTWNVNPLYCYFEERKNQNRFGRETNLLSLSYGNIVRKDIKTNEGLLPASFNTYNIVEPGDIIIRPTDLQNDKHSLRTGLVKEHGIVTSAYIALKASKSINPAYYHYLLYAYDVIKVFYNMGNGVRQGLNFSELSRLKVLEPSHEEQNQIVAFLDARCFEIDSIIDDIKIEIQTLNQYKQSLVFELVRKGLNEKIELTDSEVDWIGKIPTHWMTIRAKYLFVQRKTKGNKKNLILLSPTQKYGVIPQTLYEEYSGMTAVKLKENYNLEQLKTICKGDYCISLRSFQGGFEYSDYDGVVSPAYQVFYPRIDICDGYFKYLFKDTAFIQKINSFAMSLRDGKSISFENFSNMYLPFPPIQEQNEIASFLNKKFEEIDLIIEDKKRQIDTLDEYRKSMIYEYVTGKREVTRE